MPMTTIVTRGVEDRYKGFLGSIMLELAPGVYAHARLSAGVRGRIIDVLEDWYSQRRNGSIVVCWAENTANGTMGLKVFGELPRQIIPHGGTLLVRRIEGHYSSIAL
jgi:CRISPR-associated protein Cas2